MNKWNKVEKKKTFTRADEFYEYFKMALLISMGLGYMYLLWF